MTLTIPVIIAIALGAFVALLGLIFAAFFAKKALEATPLSPDQILGTSKVIEVLRATAAQMRTSFATTSRKRAEEALQKLNEKNEKELINLTKSTRSLQKDQEELARSIDEKRRKIERILKMDPDPTSINKLLKKVRERLGDMSDEMSSESSDEEASEHLGDMSDKMSLDLSEAMPCEGGLKEHLEPIDIQGEIWDAFQAVEKEHGEELHRLFRISRDITTLEDYVSFSGGSLKLCDWIISILGENAKATSDFKEACKPVLALASEFQAQMREIESLIRKSVENKVQLYNDKARLDAIQSRDYIKGTKDGEALHQAIDLFKGDDKEAQTSFVKETRQRMLQVLSYLQKTFVNVGIVDKLKLPDILAGQEIKVTNCVKATQAMDFHFDPEELSPFVPEEDESLFGKELDACIKSSAAPTKASAVA